VAGLDPDDNADRENQERHRKPHHVALPRLL
jgi:hypothetical protein